MNSINVISAENTGGRIDVGEATGSTEMLMYIYDLDPGEGSSPYHYEYDEEWLLVVEGTVVVRTPHGEHTLERGDVVCFPAGPGGAHTVMNRSAGAASDRGRSVGGPRTYSTRSVSTSTRTPPSERSA